MNSEQIGSAKIIYTRTDEAPALATYSFLPIVQALGTGHSETSLGLHTVWLQGAQDVPDRSENWHEKSH